VLSGWRLCNEYLFKVKSECVESSGERKTIERLVLKAYKRSEFSVVKSVISQQSKLNPGVQEVGLRRLYVCGSTVILGVCDPVRLLVSVLRSIARRWLVRVQR
jgi:hypothetical protein